MPAPPHDRKNGTLSVPDAREQQKVMALWRDAVSGMDGPRGLLPEAADEPVAYKLLDAAGDAISQGDQRRGVAILRLVVKEYRDSREAACARTVIDRLSERERGRT